MRDYCLIAIWLFALTGDCMFAKGSSAYTVLGGQDV